MTSWTATEINTRASALDVNPTTFHVTLRYIYLHGTTDITPSVTDVKNKIKDLHQSLIFPTLANTCDTNINTFQPSYIYTSATATLPDENVTDRTISDAALKSLVTSSSTLSSILTASGIVLPDDGSLVVIIVQNLSMSGIPIPLFDTHSLKASDMISRYGFVSSSCLGLDAVSPFPIFNQGKTILHALGHMLGLPHTFEYGNCTASFVDSLNPTFSKKLSLVHGGPYMDQQYDNTFAFVKDNTIVGTNAQRVSTYHHPKPLDFYNNDLTQFNYSCDVASKTGMEGALRLMDVAPDEIRRYFTKSNAELMRRNLMNYDKLKFVTGASAKFTVTQVVFKDKPNDPENPKPPTTNPEPPVLPPIVDPPIVDPPPPTPPVINRPSNSLSVGVIVGIVIGVSVFLLGCVALGYYYYRRRKNAKQAVAQPSVAQPETQEAVPEPESPMMPERPAEPVYNGPKPTYDIIKAQPIYDQTIRPPEIIDWENEMK